MKPFQIATIREYPPSGCALCRQYSEHVRIIDTKIDVPKPANARSSWKYRLYVCEHCVGELQKTLGLPSIQQVQDISEERAQLAERVEKLSSDLNEAHSLLDAARSEVTKKFLDSISLSPNKAAVQRKPRAVPKKVEKAE